MAVTSKYYLATPQIAERAGLINARYRVRDGRFILSYQDLKLVRFTSEEMLTGIGQSVQEVQENQARVLIAENGYKIGHNDEHAAVIEQQSSMSPVPNVNTNPQT